MIRLIIETKTSGVTFTNIEGKSFSVMIGCGAIDLALEAGLDRDEVLLFESDHPLVDTGELGIVDRIKRLVDVRLYTYIDVLHSLCEACRIGVPYFGSPNVGGHHILNGKDIPCTAENWRNK